MSVIVSSSGSLSSLELLTGNLIKSYKQSENVARGTAVLRSERGAAVSLLAVQQNKPLIHHYSLKKETAVKRIVLPAKLEVLAVSPNQQWLAAGSKQGSIYVWNLWSGALKALHTEAHFQSVTDLDWSKDSTVLVSGGADARVIVWRLIDLISNPGASPVHTLSTHSLPVVSVKFSAGSYRECRLYTASLDATVCVFDIYTGRLLYTLSCDSPIHAFALDSAERAAYLGTENGVHMVPLYYEPTPSAKLTAVGCADGSVISTNSFEKLFRLDNSSTTVSALCLSADGSHLLVGCEDGSLSTWEVGSGQLVKRFRLAKGRVCELTYVPNNHASAEEFQGLPVLQRNLEPQSDALDFVPRPLPLSKEEDEEKAMKSDRDELCSIEEYGALSSGAAIRVDKDDSQEVDNELQDLKKRHDELRKMYDALWTRQTSGNA